MKEESAPWITVKTKVQQSASSVLDSHHSQKWHNLRWVTNMHKNWWWCLSQSVSGKWEKISKAWDESSKVSVRIKDEPAKLLPGATNHQPESQVYLALSPELQILPERGVPFSQEQ